MESAITAAAVWSLYFLLRLLSAPRLKYSILLGISLGLGLFVKNSALIFFVTALVILWLTMLRDKRLFYPLFLSQFSISAVFIIVNLPLLFQPLYWGTFSTNSRWTFTLGELLHFPVGQWLSNLGGNAWIAFLFLTPLIFVLALLGSYRLIRSRSRTGLIISFWFLISFTLYILSLRFMNFMSFRYLTPFLPPLLILAADFLSRRPGWFRAIAFSLPAAVSVLLILNPVLFFRTDSAVNRYSYTAGYVTGFDTGYQVNALVTYFRRLAAGSDIVVTTAVHSFNPESGVWDYLRKDPNLTVAYLDGRLFGNTDDIDCLKADRPVYFIAKLDDTVGLDKFLDKVTVITNPHNSDYSTIYRVKSDCTGTSATLNLSN